MMKNPITDKETEAANDGEWAPELAELALRRQQAAAMGGPEALAKLKERGKLNARERIAALLDDASFREFGRTTGKGSYDKQGNLTGLSPVNAIFGTGRIDARKVVISADDYTIRAGRWCGSSTPRAAASSCSSRAAPRRFRAIRTGRWWSCFRGSPWSVSRLAHVQALEPSRY